MTGNSANNGNARLTKKPENWEFITDKTVERLLKAAPVNRIIWDQGSGSYKGKVVYAVRGFGVRITKAGTVSFVLNFHDQDGKERRYRISRHPEHTPRPGMRALIQKEHAAGEHPSFVNPRHRRFLDFVAFIGEWAVNDAQHVGDALASPASPTLRKWTSTRALALSSPRTSQ